MNDLNVYKEVVDCSPRDLDLDRTLASGQAFRWRRTEDGAWRVCLEPEGRVVTLRRTADGIEVESSAPGAARRMAEYFRLDEPLAEWAENWSRIGGPEIAANLHAYPGVRVLRQDPWECLVSFLASPAAPIYRIMRAMERLSERLGERAEGDARRFPSPDALKSATRPLCDECGLGFRGPNIVAAASHVLDRGGRDWLLSLREASYADAKRELMRLTGVGEKVADCVCLFSLDKDEAVPIDVHIARVARNLVANMPRSLTPRTYSQIGDHFRERFGPRAGWAQQYLYVGQIEAPRQRRVQQP